MQDSLQPNSGPYLQSIQGNSVYSKCVDSSEFGIVYPPIIMVSMEIHDENMFSTVLGMCKGVELIVLLGAPDWQEPGLDPSLINQFISSSLLIPDLPVPTQI